MERQISKYDHSKLLEGSCPTVLRFELTGEESSIGRSPEPIQPTRSSSTQIAVLCRGLTSSVVPVKSYEATVTLLRLAPRQKACQGTLAIAVDGIWRKEGEPRNRRVRRERGASRHVL